MAQRHEVEAWVHPAAWSDEGEARRVVDAIMESGSDREADWVELAGGGMDDILAAAARDSDAAGEAASEATEALYARIRAAYADGMTPTRIAAAAGMSRQMVHRIVRG